MIKVIAKNVGCLVLAGAVLYVGADIKNQLDDYEQAFERMDRQVADVYGCKVKITEAVGKNLGLK